TVLWTVSLGFMGVACLINASRCGRIHCFFTGPFFILCAAASLGYGLGILPFGPSGWKWIGDVTVVGAIVLTFVPERILGRYRRDESASAYPIDEATTRQRDDGHHVCHDTLPWLISFSLDLFSDS